MLLLNLVVMGVATRHLEVLDKVLRRRLADIVDVSVILRSVVVVRHGQRV